MFKRFFLPLILLSFRVAGLSQVSNTGIALLRKLDSIQSSPSIARHFGELYFSTTIKAVKYFLDKDPVQKVLIERFETRFAGLFFRAANEYESDGCIPPAWEAYFSDTGYTKTGYQLLGINAHINSDIWKALTEEFSLQELKDIKKAYNSFYRSLKKQYLEFYAEAYRTNPQVRLAHFSTAGLQRLYGKLLLKKWRKRQYHLALLYYTNLPEFEREQKKLEEKKNHIDDLILAHLRPGLVIFAPRKK